MTIDEVTGGKIRIGSTTYEMVEAKYNGVVVWPASQPVVTTYTVVAASVYYTYSDGGNILLANGNNLASAWGDVLVQEDGVTVDTLYGQRLDVFLPEGSYFHINSNRIQGDNLGTNEVGPYDSDVLVSYLTSARVTATTKIYQEQNVDTVTIVEGEKVYDHTHDVTTYNNYGISFSSDKYTSDIAGGRCPAYGGSASLSLSAWHWETIMTPWTKSDTVTHTFTSTATYTETVTTRGTEQTGGGQVPDTAVITGSAIWANRSNLNVAIASYATQPLDWDEGRNVTYTATVTKHDGTTLTSSVTLYQDADSYNAQDDTTATERIWDTETQTVYSNFQMHITINRYTHATSTDECPASGGFAGFGARATRDATITRGYDDVTTVTHHWVSGRETSDIPTVSHGTIIVSGPTTETDPTPVTVQIPSAAQSWLSYDAELNQLIFDTEGTTLLSNGRSATVTATNGNASDSVTVYQEKNTRTAVFDYNMSVAIQSDTATLPGAGGRFGVVYVSEYSLYYRYTSDATTPPTTNTYNSTVMTNGNCTTDVGTVSDRGVFYIDVTQNPSASDTRTIGVWLHGERTDSQHDTIEQDAYVAPVQKEATFEPWMINMQNPQFVIGKVYYQFQINSGTVTSSTITGVNFCYRINGGTKQTVQIGSFSVSETSQPMALEPPGVNIPTFSTGTGLVKAWFEVTGLTGDFDIINADENDYSIEITF